MRIVYYTHPHFLEPALHFTQAISRIATCHLFLELSPGAWRSGMFDLEPIKLPSGLLAGGPILDSRFPDGVNGYWKSAATFHLVSHNSRRSIHPSSWWTSHQAIRAIRRFRPDVLHLDDPDMSLRIAQNILELRRIPIVLNVHDPAPHSGETGWRKRLARKLIFPHVRRFILHNETQVERFSYENSVARDRISVMKLGSYDIYREWAIKPVAQQECTVLFFGRLSPYKGLETLYEAMQKVAQRVAGVRLIIAGSPGLTYKPPPPPALSRGGVVEMRQSYIGNEELAELFQRATVVVCPYLDATQSGVVLTAYAFNRPVVASSVGGISEYVFDYQTGLTVPPGDSSALATALVELLTNADLRDRIQVGIESRKAREYSWDCVGQTALQIYEKALNG